MVVPSCRLVTWASSSSREPVGRVSTVSVRMPPLAHKGLLNRLILFVFFFVGAIMVIPVRLCGHPRIVGLHSFFRHPKTLSRIILDIPDLYDAR